MISHVLGKGQGFPQKLEMIGKFNNVASMLRTFFHNHEQRSGKPEQEKDLKPELILITFTDDEIRQIMRETGWTNTRNAIDAVADMATCINEELGLIKGFEAVIFDTNPESDRLYIGLLFCPDSMDIPMSEDSLSTGPTQDENLEPVSYIIMEFFKRKEADF